MKKPLLRLFVLGLIFILTAVLFAETLIVKIQTTNLRKEPKFYAQSLTVLKAGENLERLDGKDGWIQVRTAGGLVGWIHSSSVEPKKFSLLALDKSAKTQATAGEVALAGKGFNKQVEESYRAKHGEISFEWVEKMLRMKASPSQVEEFLRKGKLGEFGGGR